MAKNCFIRIHDDDQIDYLVLEEGKTLLSGSAFHSDQLPEFPDDLNTHLIVPGEDVLLLETTMPKTSRSQLLKALPYALEEQLIENVDNLHFAVSKQDQDGNITAAVVKKSLMQQWLQKCHDYGFYPQTAVPDFLAIPTIVDKWHIYLDAEQAILRQATLKGMTIEQNQLNTLLPIALAEHESIPPNAIVIDYDDGNEHFEVESLSAIAVPLEMAQQDTFCMQLFADGLQTPSDINLLQGEYLVAKPKNKSNLIWKWVAILFVALCVVWFVGNIAQYFVFKARLKTATTKVTQLYKQAFPEAQQVVSPRYRIEQALKQRQSAGSGGAFLGILTQVGQLISQSKTPINIENFNFRNNTLSLSVSAQNFQALAALTQALQSQGLNAQQQNSSTQGKTVTARIVISGAANG